MADKDHLFKLANQQPVLQLFILFLLVLIAGTFLLTIFILAGSGLFGTGIKELLIIPPAGAGEKAQMILKYLLSSQQIALFIVPALLFTSMMKGEGRLVLGMNTSPWTLDLLLVIILAFLLFPVTSFTGLLNSKMSLPDWLSGVENWMRVKEETASHATGILISSFNIRDMTINILVLAVFPAFGEELIFRGALQQILCRIFRSGHKGIWVTAFLFSLLHFQFFGFIPRLILGLVFGYLFYWTRNLWMSIAAHFINNAVPVVLSFFIGWKKLNEKALSLSDRQIIIPMASVLFCFLILYHFRSEYRKKSVENIHVPVEDTY